MELHIPLKLAEDVADALKEQDKIDKVLVDAIKTSPFRRKVVVEGLNLGRRAVRLLVKNLKDTDNAPYATNLRFLSASLKQGSRPLFTSMNDLLEAFKQFFQTNRIKNYVFRHGEHDAVQPFLVAGLTQDNNRGYYNRSIDVPRVSFSLLYSSGDSASIQDSYVQITPSELKSIFEVNGILHTETVRKVGKGDDQYEILTNVTSKTPVSLDVVFKYLEVYPETEQLHALYDKQLERFANFLPKYGTQFRVRGSSTSGQLMLVEGRPSRAIMTTIPRILIDENTDGSRSSSSNRSRFSCRRTFGNSSYGYDDDYSSYSRMTEAHRDDMDYSPEIIERLQESTVEDLQLQYVNPNNADDKVLVPLHPILTVFHLEKHSFFAVHVNNLMQYAYKKDAADSLILPPELKEQSEMLVAAGTSEDAEDVIEGKSQATIIAAVGDPGLGKTLLAEVMAEQCEKPLYKVQAAQLGESPDQLEQTLYRLLRRAERWNALVMIDEANAYIHSRGNDIKQNAIVGVFLRLLEYYRGTLMLTTNHTTEDGMDFDIDDAILSRCSAVFQFELPTPDMAKKIWLLQARLLKIELPESLVSKLIEKFHLSGRSIRNLLRRSDQWATRKKEPLSFKHFTLCANYLPRTRAETKNDAKVAGSTTT